MQRVLFYLPVGAIFEATEYYCNLIEKAFDIRGGFFISRVNNLDDLNENDYLITIRISDPFNLKVSPKKIIHWFQGIAPEERIMLGGNSLFSMIASFKYRYLEDLLLKKVDLAIFVSDEMRIHFEKKYKINLIDKSVVIPCYNIQINFDSFLNEERYRTPSFVYAGGVQKWQCVEESIKIFSMIQKRIPDAFFVILTNQNDKAKHLIEKYDVQNVTIKYVSLDKLQRELSLYKYGFLVRKDNVINRVATPTKMNSYLAAGLIPIYTSFISDFEKNIDLHEYSLKFQEIDILKISNEIYNFEKNVINNKSLYNVYKKIFDKYYNDSFNINKITNKLVFLNEK